MSSSTHYALDLMLKQLVGNAEFSQLRDKNWEAISRLIPGTTVRQCITRYDQLCKEQSSRVPSCITNGPFAQTSGRPANKPTPEIEDSKIPSFAPGSGKLKGSKAERQPTSKALSTELSDHGPMMTIHVCDEAKNLKQDFHCPRDLLVTEMKYFAEYLSNDAQRWEEVDISVHCDVQIFDWLMKYVKRYTSERENPPKLEPNNVISILISSDFLKMDALVSECIEYCHGNLSAIVATPCNMNCINDVLTTRIADLFTQNEMDEIKDRKDKFKSKLFAKKLEKLFDPEPASQCSPESAASLYRCSECKKLLTKSIEKRLKCCVSRMTIDQRGNVVYTHIRDPAFNVSDYLLELKADLKSWRDVYWRVWGLINWLSCSRCGEAFPCSQLGQCRYHPERATFELKVASHATASPVGNYPCCHRKALRFDPTRQNKGCKYRDHIVSLDVHGSDAMGQVRTRVYDDLLANRDAVCASPNKESNAMLGDSTVDDDFSDIFDDDQEFSVFENEDILSKRSETSISMARVLTDLGKTESWPAPRLEALTMNQEVTADDLEQTAAETDDEVGDEEAPRGKKSKSLKRVTVDPQAILVDAPDFSTTKNKKWDGNRSLRWNQDAQREEDQRRMTDIVGYLTKLRLNNEKLEKKQREYAGGIYSKLEAQWKSSIVPSAKGLKEPVTRGKPKIAGVRQTTLSA